MNDYDHLSGCVSYYGKYDGKVIEVEGMMSRFFLTIGTKLEVIKELNG